MWRDLVDVDPGLHVSHQKDAASARELERVLDAGKNSVTGCSGYRSGPLSFRKDREGIDILGQTRSALGRAHRFRVRFLID
jgi:hypothetical protein